ncbi:MAG: hypothetical protein AB9844_09380 [Clostridiaceae bacterium]
MKTHKSIDVVTSFKKGEGMRPLHFKISLDDECFDPVMENKVLTVTKENYTSGDGLLYDCETSSNGELSYFNLKFEPYSSKWKLWRM